MIGSARLSWLIGSGGVITAATMKTPTTAYLRFSAMPLEETIPTRARSVMSTGSWKHRPKAKISFMTSERYSLTLASSSIGRVPPPPMVSKLRKNRQAKGNSTK